MPALRIGINALYLIPGGVGGTEIYLRSLLQALADIDQINQYVVFTNRENNEGLAPNQANFSLAPQGIRAANRPVRLLWEQTFLPLAVRKLQLDVLFNPGFTAPVLCSCPSVTVFHDLQHKRHPEFFRWFDLPFWKIFLYAAAHRSRYLIAVSEATRQDVRAFYRLPAERIRVVHHGVDPAFFHLDRSGAEDYFLCISTSHPHKNLERLVRAFGRLRERHPAARLVLAGMRGFYSNELERVIDSLGLSAAVQVTGWVERERLYELVARAGAFIYPSSFEGFGMPVLEAMAAGVPTACSAIEPVAGVAGSAALHFSPLNEDAMLSAMEQLIADGELRRRLETEGPRRAAEFSWEKAARETLQVLEAAVA